MRITYYGNVLPRVHELKQAWSEATFLQKKRASRGLKHDDFQAVMGALSRATPVGLALEVDDLRAVVCSSWMNPQVLLVCDFMEGQQAIITYTDKSGSTKSRLITVMQLDRERKLLLTDTACGRRQFRLAGVKAFMPLPYEKREFVLSKETSPRSGLLFEPQN